jgi:Virulence activator alpha C-term
VALRVFFGNQTSPRRLREILTDYATQIKAQLDELTRLEAGLGETFDYPALVAGWGQRYYRRELAEIRELLHRLDKRTAAEPMDE